MVAIAKQLLLQLCLLWHDIGALCYIVVKAKWFILWSMVAITQCSGCSLIALIGYSVSFLHQVHQFVFIFLVSIYFGQDLLVLVSVPYLLCADVNIMLAFLIRFWKLFEQSSIHQKCWNMAIQQIKGYILWLAHIVKIITMQTIWTWWHLMG